MALRELNVKVKRLFKELKSDLHTADQYSSIQRVIYPPIHLILLLLQPSGPCWAQSLTKLLQCEGGVTPWASHQVIAGPRRHKPPATLTFTPTDNLRFPAEPKVHVLRLWKEVKAAGQKPTAIHRNMQRRNPFGILPATPMDVTLQYKTAARLIFSYRTK